MKVGPQALTTPRQSRGRAVLLLIVLLCSLAIFPRPARAFCGFYVAGSDAALTNDATLVALMRDGQRTILSMRNTYTGPPEDFALVVPVPVVLRESNVKVLPAEIFHRLDQLTAPRLVEYWEQDPCRVIMPEAPPAGAVAYSFADDALEEKSAARHQVKIEARFAVGEYDVVVLSAQDSSGLDAWLRENRYKIPAGAEPYLRPYVQMGMKFFVARVNVAKVKFERVGNGPERAVLSPLRFHYDSDDFFLPVRLGLINSSGKQDLIAIVLARSGRYEIANYDNVAIPTNLDVADRVRTQFGGFYASLFDRVVAQNPRAVVTEYAWEATSCDPCPTPPLDDTELATLGADVLPEQGSGSGGFVVTRLHARYGKDTLGDDLHFRPARPITGGREGSGTTAQQGEVNDFQARYIIRHRWTRPVTCASPHFGEWGGPPEGNDAHGSSVAAAVNLAFAPRDVDVGSLISGAVPDGLTLSRGSPVGPPRIPPAGGCAGCATAPGASQWAAAGTCLVGLLLALRRRPRH
jgi:hypothetical protein